MPSIARVSGVGSIRRFADCLPITALPNTCDGAPDDDARRDALRRSGVNDKIEGFGRLFREF